MDRGMLEARIEDDSYRRVEVITGRRGRRSWTEAEKARIVAESLEAAANISDVARRYGVNRGLVTVWRRQARGRNGRDDVPAFVAVRLEDEPASANASSKMEVRIEEAREPIEIRMGEATVRCRMARIARRSPRSSQRCGRRDDVVRCAAASLRFDAAGRLPQGSEWSRRAGGGKSKERSP